jgi:hypothetical protein
MLCECGCGRKTTIGFFSGEPNRFIRGHSGGRGPHKDRYLDNGRPYVWVPDHHAALRSGFAPEHIVLAERVLGRRLPEGVEVHHADGDKSNNVCNLVICQDTRYHNLLHIRMRALKICGDASKRKCAYCKKYDSPTCLVQVKGRTTMFHRECAKSYMRAIRED